MISKLSKAGRQFASETATANGYEVLNAVCYRDDKARERTLEIGEILGSIKVIGPKWDKK